VKHGEGTTNLPELSLLKIFAINLPSNPFLGRHIGFPFFLQQGRTLFYSWAVFD